MLDAHGTVLYIGKAKNLKKRVSSYFQRQLDTKTLQLIHQIHNVEVTVTRNEREALLLESNLIKELNPRYNIIFKDDKSYPYLALSIKDHFPRLSFHRGARKKDHKYFGPYPNARLAREALAFLQNIFKLRQCDNAFFKSRKRPCLQYQIKRCTAPCVGHIDAESYAKDAENALLFLEGKSQSVITRFIQQMEEASDSLDYEKAAKIRDQIAILRNIQEQQIIMSGQRDTDVLGIYSEGNTACIHMLIIREGRMLGSRPFYPNTSALLQDDENKEQEWLEQFMLQHYATPTNEIEAQSYPREILVSVNLPNRKDLEDILSERIGHSVFINQNVRGLKNQWLSMALTSAKHALEARLVRKMDLLTQFELVQEVLKLEALPNRIECFDVSHSLGEATVASCVVFDSKGPVKSDYRRFNIRGLTPGDDYAALCQALTRRYTRLKSEGGVIPDILLIDGGKGQLNVAESVLRELQVVGVIPMGVAKGPNRKAGRETLFISSKGQTVELDSHSKALHLIQRIRDEAHRFAISAHRSQRAKKRIQSRLEDIPQIGKNRRIALLKQFGGLQEVMQASQEELAKVPGISQALAKQVYEALHGH